MDALAFLKLILTAYNLQSMSVLEEQSTPQLTSRLTVAEYFAGIGLVRMGMEQAGWQVVFANDISLKKYQMYEGFFPDAHLHYSVQDIFDVDPLSIPHAVLATCSFPCVDLSLAGNMNGIHGKHSSAFWGFNRILAAQGNNAPPLVMVENVHGWLHSNNGRDFKVTVEALNKLGYSCDVIALDALRFTPQSRPRVFLIGSKFKRPEGVERILRRPKSLLPERLRVSVTNNAHLDWFYQELPEPPALLKKGLSKIVEVLSDSDSRWWSNTDVERHLQMMNAPHRERVEQLSKSKQISYRTFFRRIRSSQQRAEVRIDDVAGCLRTASGGSGKQFLIRAGKGEIKMRAMTPREYARLQGVPDFYSIAAEGVQALTGFGDAVSVPVIRWIASHVLTPLIKDNIDDPELRNHLMAYSMQKDDEKFFWRIHKNKQASFLESIADDTANSGGEPA
jgi:DNA (cytosine-5)-methyltransferase 1